MEVVTAGAQDELMQSLDYKLKTSNTSYVTARHDVQHFPSSLSSFSPTTSRVCRIPLTSGTSFIDPESIKIAFRVRNTDGTNPLAPATPASSSASRSSPTASAATTSTTTAAPLAVHDLLKGREYNRNKAMEGFDEVNDPRIARAVHQGGYVDVLLRPTMVGILRCGKMLPPQLNLVIEIEFADATTALWSEVVLDSALVESFNRALLSGRSLVFSYPTVHTQQSSVPNGVAEHNVTVARAFTKLMGAFVTFWDNDAGSKIHLLANPGQDVAPIGAARQESSRDWLTLSYCPSISRGPRCAARRCLPSCHASQRLPGLHRLRLGLQRMLVHSRVCFLYGVPYLQKVTSTQGRRSMNGRVFSRSKCAMISRALQEPSRARRQRAAVFRADGAGPNHVEVARKRRVVHVLHGHR